MFKNKFMRWTVISLIVVVLVSGAIAGIILMTPDEHDETAVAETKKILPPAIYKAIEPPILVNFDGSNRVRYLQLGIEVMTRDKDTIHMIEKNMPAIRNNLILLLSDQSPSELLTREGKDVLRREVHNVMQETLDSLRVTSYGADDEKPRIEEIYFTNFVMQ